MWTRPWQFLRRFGTPSSLGHNDISDPNVSFGFVHQLNNATKLSSTKKRKKRAAKKRNRKRDALLRRLGTQPDEAMRSWKQLKEEERSIVLSSMTEKFGREFTDSFEEHAKAGKRQVSQMLVVRPGDEPSPENLRARGYELLKEEKYPTSTKEIWVHPSGKSIWVIRSQKGPEKMPSVAVEVLSKKLDDLFEDAVDIEIELDNIIPESARYPHDFCSRLMHLEEMTRPWLARLEELQDQVDSGVLKEQVGPEDLDLMYAQIERIEELTALSRDYSSKLFDIPSQVEAAYGFTCHDPEHGIQGDIPYPVEK